MSSLNVNEKPKIMVIFVKFNKDELDEMFEKIKEFRKTNSLKFTAPFENQIYITVNVNDMDDFRKIIKYSISKDATYTKFKCSPQEAELLQSRRDSFIKMRYNNGYMEFSSRLQHKFHKYLVRKLFDHSKVPFIRENYSVSSGFEYTK